MKTQMIEQMAENAGYSIEEFNELQELNKDCPYKKKFMLHFKPPECIENIILLEIRSIMDRYKKRLSKKLQRIKDGGNYNGVPIERIRADTMYNSKLFQQSKSMEYAQKRNIARNKQNNNSSYIRYVDIGSLYINTPLRQIATMCDTIENAYLSNNLKDVWILALDKKSRRELEELLLS